MQSISDHIQKIDILQDKIIIASSGHVGLHQRFVETCRLTLNSGDLEDSTRIEFGKRLGDKFRAEHSSTQGTEQINDVLVVYEAENEPQLVEFSTANTDFQPEWKELDKIWYASIGSGQIHADPFLVFLRSVFVSDNQHAPDLQLGKFMVFWTLLHVCDVTPGGIKEPIYLATMSKSNHQCTASMVSDDELSQLREMVNDVTTGMNSYFQS